MLKKFGQRDRKEVDQDGTGGKDELGGGDGGNSNQDMLYEKRR